MSRKLTHVLLVETEQGNTEGIRFESAEAAYAWEEATGVQGVGVIRLITRKEALDTVMH